MKVVFFGAECRNRLWERDTDLVCFGGERDDFLGKNGPVRLAYWILRDVWCSVNNSLWGFNITIMLVEERALWINDQISLVLWLLDGPGSLHRWYV